MQVRSGLTPYDLLFSLFNTYISFLSLLFFLTKKVTKKSRRFNAVSSLRLKISSAESPAGTVIILEGFRLETPLRVFRGFLKALNFSLSVHSYLMFRLVKNEALEHLFKSNSWHLS